MSTSQASFQSPLTAALENGYLRVFYAQEKLRVQRSMRPPGRPGAGLKGQQAFPVSRGAHWIDGKNWRQKSLPLTPASVSPQETERTMAFASTSQVSVAVFPTSHGPHQGFPEESTEHSEIHDSALSHAVQSSENMSHEDIFMAVGSRLWTITLPTTDGAKRLLVACHLMPSRQDAFPQTAPLPGMASAYPVFVWHLTSPVREHGVKRVVGVEPCFFSTDAKLIGELRFGKLVLQSILSQSATGREPISNRIWRELEAKESTDICTRPRARSAQLDVGPASGDPEGPGHENQHECKSNYDPFGFTALKL
ncbi:hypothetical protein H920_08125 [Fukomys damarensis]|uniref:Uncharacterized protein n=1 Tax=Fukomys damarensis TaxID=885580 RepID=A0A091DE51_FUKDA|nr:hypothetical protein H920_08125 [Fukomys damarensis]